MTLITGRFLGLPLTSFREALERSERVTRNLVLQIVLYNIGDVSRIEKGVFLDARPGVSTTSIVGDYGSGRSPLTSFLEALERSERVTRKLVFLR
jgi:ABC-type histidine transport system ATPase subunit